MSNLFRGLLCGALLLAAPSALAQGEPEYSSQGTQGCLHCHDFGPEAPVHSLLDGSHGISGDAEAMAGRRGCEDCHGPSAAHAQAPREISPLVSFGPRWTSSAAAQDGQCLACHEDNVAAHWSDALHMVNGLTCVTCHDLLVEEDRVLFDEQQAGVCTTCHKEQKQGIHGLGQAGGRNPPCSGCHNPHDHGSAGDAMAANDSAACRYCHDLALIPGQAGTDKAADYHGALAQPNGTCLQCHQGLAHSAADGVPPMRPVPATSGSITLFYPGMADSDWLLQAHPGSQPLRQGTDCRRCHRGEEAALGASRADGFTPASRELQVSFSHDDNDLLIELQWPGDENDLSLSLMWAGYENRVFRRGGCFAACHSDMPGMSRDSGAQYSKYLKAARQPQPQTGQRPAPVSEAEQAELLRRGQFAELWQIPLNRGAPELGTVLAETRLQSTELIQVNKEHKNGRWRVALRRKMDNTDGNIGFFVNNKYTFGVALSNIGNRGSGHWVSLPRTLSFQGDDTDFTAE